MKGKSASTKRRGRHFVRRAERNLKEPKESDSSSPESLSHPSPSLQPLLLLLKQDYERLKEEIRHLALLPTRGLEPANDPADEANDVVEQSRCLALRRNLEVTLKQIEHALLRQEAGTYGLCERCGGLIHPERLSALPYASLCIGCASLHAA